MTGGKELNRICAQAVTEGVGEVAFTMERNWVSDHLRRVVSDDLRKRYYRQA